MPRKDIEKFTVSHLRILDPEGKADKKLEPDVSPEDLERLYRAMVLTRAADERMLKLQRQGRLGTFAPVTGQEAAHCAPVLAMTDQDWFVGSFRETGSRLMRGEPLASAFEYYNGFEEGNVVPDGVRNLPIAVIVASQLPHAVGIGYAMKLRKEPNAVLAFVGDGGTSQGDFYEALNFAGVWQVPVVFVIQNNHWAISLPRSAQTRSATLAQKAIAAGMPGIQVDGNDALAMLVAAREALELARSGGGPTLIEAVTYRMAMHTTADDPGRYRSDEEVAEWAKKDPILRLRKYLEGRSLWDDAREEALADSVRSEIETAVLELEKPREHEPDAAFDHVFGTQHPGLDEQRAEFLAGLGEAKNG
jgi:pyruvate dehydrogenase E1 component alpha subunit